MNNKTKLIIDKLIEDGLITSENDLTAGDKTNIIFDCLVTNYSYMLNHDLNIVFKNNDFNSGQTIHKLLMMFGKYFLSNPQIFENKGCNIEEPVIFVSNHYFKDDVLATLLAAEKRAYILFGSLPYFYNTLDGILLLKTGVIMVNRKVLNSKKTSIEKCKYVLDKGRSLIIFPEGVWNKKPNGLLLDFWSGFYRIAKKEDGSFYKIVPIIHYVKETYTKGKQNPIHTFVSEPVDISGMSEEEATNYIKNIMLTEKYKMMEKYGKTTRKQLLDGFDNCVDAWENELKNRILTAYKYDEEIEKISHKKTNNNAIDVWNNISNLEINKYNLEQVIYAKQLVKELKKNDFQSRF